MTNNRFNVRRIESEIKKTFEGESEIDLKDIQDKNKAMINDCLLSRGLAAYSLYSLADISAKEAAAAIVDGYGDNGIDAIYFDENQDILWLVQAKWKQNGRGQLDTGDLEKFKTGILDIQNENKSAFNKKIQLKWDQIQSAILSDNLRIKIVVSYTGGSLSSHNRKVINTILKELNYFSELASVEIFNLERINQAIINNKKENNIDIKFQLMNWGRVDFPFVAYYGQIKATELAKWWGCYNTKLFNKNIRSFIGYSNVNQEISRTLLEEPTLFWYFNNGITVLCKELKKIGIGRDTRISDFYCKGISVINGAQTIGSIGDFFGNEESRDKLEEADVFIRFISLEDCPEDFGVRVTRATNTQNRIEERDFVSLDEEQERLRLELQIQNKEYIYKRSKDDKKSSSNCCNLREATIALACSDEDVKLCVLVKKEINKLWSDTSKHPYKKLFNPSLTGLKLWRCVEVLRLVDDALQSKLESNEESELGREILEYGDRFILYSVFRYINRIRKDALFSENYDFSKIKQKEIPNFIEKVVREIEDTLEEYESEFSVSLSRVFKTMKACERLKELME